MAFGIMHTNIMSFGIILVEMLMLDEEPRASLDGICQVNAYEFLLETRSLT